MGNSSLKIRVARFTKQRVCDALPRRGRRKTEASSPQRPCHARPCHSLPGFSLFEEVEKKGQYFFFYLIFMHFTVVRNYKIFGNFDSGSVGQVIGPVVPGRAPAPSGHLEGNGLQPFSVEYRRLGDGL